MKVQAVNSNYGIKRENSKVKSPSFKRDWSEHISWGANYFKESGMTNFKLFSFSDAKAVFVEVASKIGKDFGNITDRIVQVLATAGAVFSINDIISKDSETTVYPMQNEGNGIYKVDNIIAEPDSQYRFIIVDKGNNIKIVKDPYAKRQENIHGWSTIYNSDNYEWQNTEWLSGNDPRRIVRKPFEPYRGLENLVIEEVNIPTITSEGDFESAISYIDRIAERGVATAVELMPVENTFSKQWGYDGVDKFAVNEKLGGAIGLKKLIDYAHGKGLNIIMDMVPNHMGPDGDYLTQTGPYESGAGDFGSKLNYEGSENRYVRDWMANAALWWANEFKVDGIRFDLTKETNSDYLLKQIVEELNEHNPQVFTIAEDGRENQFSVTNYERDDNIHNDRLSFIDLNIDYIHSKGWKPGPSAIGFDSEWDFPLMKAVKSIILDCSHDALENLDYRMSKSGSRIKYLMIHDEIGNNDGTRLIPKVIARHLNFFENINGSSDAERGQKAAQMSQKLAELILTNPDATPSDLATIQGMYDSRYYYDKDNLISAMKLAIAKQKLAHGTVMTIPGPKLYFQGDDAAEIAPFKFFREFSGEREHINDSPVQIYGDKKKGYNPFIDEALPDSVIESKGNYEGVFKNLRSQMVAFNQDLLKIIRRNPALTSGYITARFKEHDKMVHIHRVSSENNDLLIIKNYADNFYFGNYSSLGFPKDGRWIEVFNSDDVRYGGGGMTNGTTLFSDLHQNLNLSANSFIILKKINDV